MRLLGHVLLALFIAVLIAPAVIVCDFVIEREHIARDLCVQRMVPDAKRTCHGECCLMKRLKKTEQHEQNKPQQLRLPRLDDMTNERPSPVLGNERSANAIVGDPRYRGILPGFGIPRDPVPWC